MANVSSWIGFLITCLVNEQHLHYINVLYMKIVPFKIIIIILISKKSGAEIFVNVNSQCIAIDDSFAKPMWA